LDDRQAAVYFEWYFTWYDTEHYRSGIDYVTPQKAHDGLRRQIADQKRAKKHSQHLRRRVQNQKDRTEKIKNHNKTPASLVA
jgi:hypothetical protein